MVFFFFNDTATTEIYTLSLHDALPISDPRVVRPVLGELPPQPARHRDRPGRRDGVAVHPQQVRPAHRPVVGVLRPVQQGDRKSTRLNSSHANISYAVFCLKKKKKCMVT